VVLLAAIIAFSPRVGLANENILIEEDGERERGGWKLNICGLLGVP
jgi:hypothetical protein